MESNEQILWALVRVGLADSKISEVVSNFFFIPGAETYWRKRHSAMGPAAAVCVLFACVLSMFPMVFASTKQK